MDGNALFSGFCRSATHFPDRPAIVAEGQSISYGDLFRKARSIAATIQKKAPSREPGVACVFAYRSLAAFEGVLGVLLSGNGYVPLNRTFPNERSLIMLKRAGCRVVIVDEGSMPHFLEILKDIGEPLLVIFPGVDVENLKREWPMHNFIGPKDLEPAESWMEPAVNPDDIAYLLFTSGSTGIPKGVMVAHRNVRTFLDFMVERYQITADDRLSQMFDMTFDLSVFDMFVAWEKGACVCCPTQKTLINPSKFIKDMKLTLWFSVPSTVVFMKRLGMLKPDNFPSLRWSLFCGEALPMDSIQAWEKAAPNSVLENLYGPTELTIACCLYRWDPRNSPSESEMGVVPIGYPYPNMKVMVVDENLKDVPPGGIGELVMSGPQMTPGYWKDPEITKKAFITLPNGNEVFYRTGDRVRKPVGDGPLTYLGRVDFQVKIQGHRVELGEIEQIVREESGLDGVVAVGWPKTTRGFDAVEVFLEGERVDEKKLYSAVSDRLPDYMIPKKYHFMDRLPLNVNGKYDRKALYKILEELQ